MVGAYYAVSLYTNKSVFRYVNTYCILFSNGNMTELTGNTTAMPSIPKPLFQVYKKNSYKIEPIEITIKCDRP